MKSTDLEQIEVLQKLNAQLTYELNQVAQMKQAIWVTEAQIDQKMLGLTADPANPAAMEHTVITLIQSMRRCTARTVGDLKAISDRATRSNGRAAESAPPAQEEATAPPPAAKPQAAVSFEE